MKRETTVATNRKLVAVSVPESAEDQAEIYRLADAGAIDVQHSFGDQPAVRYRLYILARLALRIIRLSSRQRTPS